MAFGKSSSLQKHCYALGCVCKHLCQCLVQFVNNDLNCALWLKALGHLYIRSLYNIIFDTQISKVSKLST